MVVLFGVKNPPKYQLCLTSVFENLSLKGATPSPAVEAAT